MMRSLFFIIAILFISCTTHIPDEVDDLEANDSDEGYAPIDTVDHYSGWTAAQLNEEAVRLERPGARSCIKDAIQLSISVLKISRGDHEAYWNKLNFLLLSDKSDEVLRLIDSTIAKEPDIPGNYFFKGIVYDIRHDNRNALISYKKDIELYNNFLKKLKSEDPDYKTAIFNKAIDQIYSGNKEGNKTLQAMLINEKNQDLKELIDLFVNADRNDLINMDRLCNNKVFVCPILTVNL